MQVEVKAMVKVVAQYVTKTMVNSRSNNNQHIGRRGRGSQEVMDIVGKGRKVISLVDDFQKKINTKNGKVH